MSDATAAAVTLLFLAAIYLFLWVVARAIGRHLSAAASPPATLALHTLAPPAAAGRTITVDRPLVAGRSPDADIVLADPFTSDLHCRVFTEGGRLVVADLGSTNGTFVNDTRIGGPTSLARGDTVRLGGTIMEVR